MKVRRKSTDYPQSRFAGMKIRYSSNELLISVYGLLVEVVISFD